LIKEERIKEEKERRKNQIKLKKVEIFLKGSGQDNLKIRIIKKMIRRKELEERSFKLNRKNLFLYNIDRNTKN